MRINKDEFFSKYHVSEEDFDKAGYSWEELMEIYEDYVKDIKELKILANFIDECLTDVKKAHLIKKRVKDPYHLLRKIIRKKLDNPKIALDKSNYRQVITDLIGIRVLHLFKEGWSDIHEEIVGKWVMKEVPVANIREGDSKEMIDKFRNKGLEINKHKFGYRSLHYQILLLHNKKEITAEIQVRTLFEEAWSEIDHRIRYPYNANDPILSEYLVIFNRLAGSADEMGSFIRHLKKDIDGKNNKLAERGMLIDEIIKEIKISSLPALEKENLINNIDRLKNHFRIKEESPTAATYAITGPDLKNNDLQKSSDDINTDNLEELMRLEKDMGIHG